MVELCVYSHPCMCLQRLRSDNQRLSTVEGSHTLTHSSVWPDAAGINTQPPNMPENTSRSQSDGRAWGGRSFLNGQGHDEDTTVAHCRTSTDLFTSRLNK